MPDFLEERLSVSVRYGASYGDEYAVETTETAGGDEFSRLIHPYPVRRFDIAYRMKTQEIWDSVLSLYHRVYGRYAGFRVRCLDDFSTNGTVGAPTAFDQALGLVSAGVYQLQKEYGAGGTPLAIGRPVRVIYKPVAGTVLVGIVNAVTGNQTPPAAAWSVDSTTGRVTFATNKSASITAITQAANAVLTLGSHMLVVGDSIFISGVVGMTQINGRRAPVSAVAGANVTVAIDSSAFSAYTSGGTVNTRPQVGEAVKGGCEFDFPCKFVTRVDVRQSLPTVRESESIEIKEILNP